MLRLRADGSLDGSNGSGGIAKLVASDGGLRAAPVTPVFAEGPEALFDMALLPDGKLLLLSAGLAAAGFESLVLVARLTEGGQLDASFGDSGSVSSQQQPSFSGFRVDVVDASGVLVESAPLSNLLGLHGVVYPQPADLDVIANVYVVVTTPRGWYMRNTAGNFVPWNARIAELVPAFTNVKLARVTHVPVYAGRLPFAGTYRLYLGYRRADSTNVIYADEAAALRITPP